jgi:hypothetical protein
MKSNTGIIKIVILFIFLFSSVKAYGTLPSVENRFFTSNQPVTVSNTNTREVVITGTALNYTSYYRVGMRLYSPAYSFGGYDDLNTFRTRMASGNRCGNDEGEFSRSARTVQGVTTYHILNHATGIDCSGFVTTAWNGNYNVNLSKLGTQTIPGKSFRIPAWQLGNFDVLNRIGSHVVLFERNTGNRDNRFGYNNNRAYIYESGGGGGRYNIPDIVNNQLISENIRNFLNTYNPNRGVRYGVAGEIPVKTPFYRNQQDYNAQGAENSGALQFVINNTDDANPNRMNPIDDRYLARRYGEDSVPPRITVTAKKGNYKFINNQPSGEFDIEVFLEDTQTAGVRMTDTKAQNPDTGNRFFSVKVNGREIMNSASANVQALTEKKSDGNAMSYRVVNGVSEGIRLDQQGNQSLYRRTMNLKWNGNLGNGEYPVEGKLTFRVEAEDFEGNRGMGETTIQLNSEVNVDYVKDNQPETHLLVEK